MKKKERHLLLPRSAGRPSPADTLLEQRGLDVGADVEQGVTHAEEGVGGHCSSGGGGKDRGGESRPAALLSAFQAACMTKGEGVAAAAHRTWRWLLFDWSGGGKGGGRCEAGKCHRQPSRRAVERARARKRRESVCVRAKCYILTENAAGGVWTGHTRLRVRKRGRTKEGKEGSTFRLLFFKEEAAPARPSRAQDSRLGAAVGQRPRPARPTASARVASLRVETKGTEKEQISAEMHTLLFERRLLSLSLHDEARAAVASRRQSHRVAAWRTHASEPLRPVSLVV